MAGDVKNFPGGKPIVILGTDGTDLYGFTVDTSGHVQVDVLSNALPTGAATETTLASVLAKLDVALSTRALESGGNLADIKTAAQLIDDLRNALGSVNTDDLQVDVKSSALPTDAATQTTLASALTALQLIDGIALESNKLFGYNARYSESGSDLAAAGGNVNKYGTAVPAGEIWVLQAIYATDATTAIAVQLGVNSGAGFQILKRQLEAAAADDIFWTGELVLSEGDYCRVQFLATVAGDDLYWRFWGYKMKIS